MKPLKILTDGEIDENEKWNLKLVNAKNCDKVILVLKDYEKIIRCKKKWIFNFAYKQGVLLKSLKQSHQFKEMLKEIEPGISTIYLKVKLVKVS